MSFRKRGEIVGGARGPAPQRGPIPSIAGRQSSVPGRSQPNVSPTSSISSFKKATNKQESPREIDISSLIMQNPGIRPSLITSQPTASTGSSDLDKILLHQGLPLGCSLLIEESGTTDFSSVLLRAFASQGIIQNRLENNVYNSHIIVLGMSPHWSNDLPGLYKGSSKDQKKAKIAENESKVSVSNIANSSSDGGRDSKMKIAWRYGLNKKDEDKNEINNGNNYENYNHQFDLTQKLQPGPNPNDISYVPLTNTPQSIISQINKIIQDQLRSNPLKIIRLIIPGFLNPSIYHPLFTQSTFVFPLVHSFRSLLRQYNNNLVLISSISLDLYPNTSNLISIFQNLFDSIIHLQPFNQEMSQLIEKAYKNEPSKIQQGLINIIKIPVLSEKGLMMIHNGEYAFKNGKKKFEIEEWGIPVEDDSNDKNNNTPEGGKTTKDIEF
ncbi:ELP4 [Candida pseudojiufengensis]|uniref:ELP4 n=1 Tax=Candida pseudojiufengensis TaxID=497109 RepID=UPI002224E67A|nr:ELP4 [Candida pseudojiufengensis]KAI5962241.1 ELP4 [Candida pseudojiufengensis]